MKKRKKPYLLITVLVVAGIAVGVMNTPPSSGQDRPNPSESPQTGKDIGDVPTSKDIGHQVAGDVKSPAPPTKGKPMPGNPMDPANTGPLVLKPESKPYKPTPNDSATSAQWYTDETPKEIRKAPQDSVPIQKTTQPKAEKLNR